MIIQKYLFWIFCLFLSTGFSQSVAQSSYVRDLSQHNETILKLTEDIFSQIPRDLAEIDPRLNRIAVYRINTDNASLSPPLKAHFESKLVEVFGIMGKPAMVSLPEMSTLRISSTDSSFSVINALPSPDELWKVGRRLRVDAFLEGNLTYVNDKALYLDLRLNRTGSNEVLWAKSYAAYVRGVKIKTVNPLKMSLNAGLEVFNIEVKTSADSLHPDFNNHLVQYSIYFGIYQFMTANSKFHYELRGGVSFLSEGVRFANTAFQGSSFYGLQSGGGSFTKPISFNFRAMFYATLLPSQKNLSGDWLSVYLALTRYFANRTPDLTGIGIGFRSDLSSRFSISAGFSMIIGPEFNSLQLVSTGQSVRTRINGLHYEIMMLQFSF